MAFQARFIDVDDPAEMAKLVAVPAHRDNPFIYRLVCPVEGCHNAVWPSQMHDVRALGFEEVAALDYACDGCVSKWLRDPDVPLDVPALMAASGASEAEIAAWTAKCEAARPPVIHEDEGKKP